MKVSRNRRNWNKLIDYHKVGNRWICQRFDWNLNAWREYPMPCGWSPFGKVKWADNELAYMISELERDLESSCFLDGKAKLVECGILIGG